eukprot:m.73959 g.73959  ORF g.73959 m.73959 type:complete len:206 (+) comp24610_c0_seq1:193-810(+)
MEPLETMEPFFQQTSPSGSLPHEVHGQKALLFCGVSMVTVGLMLGFLPIALGPVVGKLHTVTLLQATLLIALSAAWPQVRLNRTNALSTITLLVGGMTLNVGGVLLATLTQSTAQVFDSTFDCSMRNDDPIYNKTVLFVINLTDFTLCALPPILFGVLATEKSNQKIATVLLVVGVLVCLGFQPYLNTLPSLPAGNNTCPFLLKI